MIYVCSDIHGQAEKFFQFYNSLNDEDEVYIIGDVIDKGPSRTSLLWTIKNDSRFHMMIGNHEDMMLTFYDIRSKSIQDDSYKGELYDISRQWLHINDGYDTLREMDQFIHRDELLDWLHHSPIVQNIQVNGRNFLLVHSNPEITYDITYDKATADQRKGCLWKRNRFMFPKIKNKTIITGHTIHQDIFYKGKSLKESYFIDIDTGCALGKAGRLCVLCLNDMTIHYYG